MKKHSNRYYSLFQQTNDAVFLLDLEGRHIEVNQRATDLLGYSAEEFLNLSFKDISADIHESAGQLKQLLRGEKLPLYERRFRKKDGSVITVEINVELVKDMGNNPLHIQSVVRDVTEKKITEGNLKKMAEIGEEFLQLDEKELDYQKITEDFLQFSEGKFSCFNLYSDSGDYYETLAIAGEKGLIKRAGKVLNRNLTGAKWKHDPIRAKKIEGSQITRFRSISELSRDIFPLNLVRIIEKIATTGEVFIIKIMNGKVMLGDFTVIMEKGKIFTQDSICEVFTRQLGLMITRQKSYKETRETKELLNTLLEETPAVIYSYLLKDGVPQITYINKNVTHVLGISPEVFIKNMDEWHKSVHPEDLPALRRKLSGVNSYDHYRFMGSNGEYRWLYDQQRVINQTEKGIELVGAWWDMTELKNIEDKLRKKEAQMRGIVESQHDLIVRVDSDNRITFVNEAYCKTFGKTEDQLIGNSFAPMVHEEDIEDTMKALEKVSNPPYRAYMEQRAMTLNGWRWIAWEDSGILDDKGNVVEIQGVGRDITNYKNALEELENSERRYRGIVDDQTELICRFSPEGVLTFVNPAYCKYFKKKEKDLIGHSFHPLIPEEDLPLIEAAQKKISFETPFVSYEHRVLTENEEIRWHNWIDRGIYDRRGNLLEYQAVGRDITSKKRAEIALEKAKAELQQRVEERTRDLLESNEKLKGQIVHRKVAEESLAAEKQLLETTLFSIGDGVITTDRNGRIIFMNAQAEAITGYSLLESMGKEIFEVYQISAQEDGDHLDGIDFKRFEMESIIDQISVDDVLTKDHQLRKVECRGAPIKKEGSESSGYVIAFRDVTKQKETERQLGLSQKLDSIGRITAGVAHEINTPMQYIGDNAEFIKNSLAFIVPMIHDYEKRKSWESHGKDDMRLKNVGEINEIEYDQDLLEEVPLAIDDLLEGVERVNKIISAMKDFSHPGDYKMEPVNITKAINDVLMILKNQLKNKVKIEKDYEDDLPIILCNLNQINQVLLNIILNGLQAIDDAIVEGVTEYGRIGILVKKVEGQLEIKITDNGKGIPESLMNKIYDPFFTTKEVGKGTGQGLAIAYDIIKNKHQGEILAKSIVHRGTEFIIRLPIGM